MADNEPIETMIEAPAVAVPLTERVESLVSRSLELTPRSSLIPPRLMETLPVEPPEVVEDVEVVEPPELLDVAGSLTPTAASVVGRNWAAAAVAVAESVAEVVAAEVDGVEVASRSMRVRWPWWLLSSCWLARASLSVQSGRRTRLSLRKSWGRSGRCWVQ